MKTPREHKHAEMIKAWLGDGDLEVEFLAKLEYQHMVTFNCEMTDYKVSPNGCNTLMESKT